MRLSIHLKLDDKKMKKFFAIDNVIYEIAQIIEVLHDHGFVHRGPLDSGFINKNATSYEDAENAIKDLYTQIDWFEDFVLECDYYETSEPISINLKELLKKDSN